MKIIQDAEKTLPAGSEDAENTFLNPKNIVPVASPFKATSKFDYTSPAMSLTVIRIKTNN
jgi:alpha-L-arabinofuranosidase